MANVTDIDDPADPRLADYVALSDADLRRRSRQPGGSPGSFIAEGELVIRRLLAAGHPVRSVLVTPARYRRLAGVLAGLSSPVFVAPQPVLNAVTGFNLHRGAVASAERLPEPDPADLLERSRTIAVLEGLNDLENLGALFRSAGALGVDAVLLDPTCADPYYRRVVRVLMGAVLAVPFTRLTPWPAALDRVRQAGFRLVGLTPAQDGRPIGAVTRRPDESVAVVVGAEGPGLGEATLAACDVAVRIPMAPGYDSLNVGHAAAIAFHHFAST